MAKFSKNLNFLFQICTNVFLKFDPILQFQKIGIFSHFFVNSFRIFYKKMECSNSCKFCDFEILWKKSTSCWFFFNLKLKKWMFQFLFQNTNTPFRPPYLYACKLDQIDQSLMYIYDMDYWVLITIGKSSKGIFYKKTPPCTKNSFINGMILPLITCRPSINCFCVLCLKGFLPWGCLIFMSTPWVTTFETMSLNHIIHK